MHDIYILSERWRRNLHDTFRMDIDAPCLGSWLTVRQQKYWCKEEEVWPCRISGYGASIRHNIFRTEVDASTFLASWSNHLFATVYWLSWHKTGSQVNASTCRNKHYYFRNRIFYFTKAKRRVYMSLSDPERIWIRIYPSCITKQKPPSMGGLIVGHEC